MIRASVVYLLGPRKLKSADLKTAIIPYSSLEQTVWQHKKGGLYRILKVGYREKDLTIEVVYESFVDGVCYIRPYKNFMDGRFTQVSEPRNSSC